MKHAEFVQRVSERASADRADAAYYGQVVMDVVDVTVPEGELQDVTAQLPDDYDELFELVGAEEYY